MCRKIIFNYYSLYLEHYSDRYPDNTTPKNLRLYLQKCEKALSEPGIGLHLQEFWLEGEMIGACWYYETATGFYLDEYYYSPEHPNLSIGTFAIRSISEEAKEKGFPYLYLGPWSDQVKAYGYKTRLGPAEMYRKQDETWVPIKSLG